MGIALQYFTGFTLVDITATGVTRGVDDHRRSQHSNWETVLQAIGLGAQPMDITAPVILEDVRMDYLEFGEFFEGSQRVWAWTFGVEHADVFAENGDPLGRLLQYFEQVPIISGLDETARFMLPIFHPYGGIRNIYFKSGVKNINNI
jgi:hypothetical protein